MVMALRGTLILSVICIGCGYGQDAYQLGYGVECAEDIRGYGCHYHHRHHHQPTHYLHHTTSKGFPVLPVIGGVAGAGVVAAGIGLIAKAVHDNSDALAPSPPPPMAPMTYATALPPASSLPPQAYASSPPAAFTGPNGEVAYVASRKYDEKASGFLANNAGTPAAGLSFAVAAVAACLIAFVAIGMAVAKVRARSRRITSFNALPINHLATGDYDQISCSSDS
jgi:hypothetical protein